MNSRISYSSGCSKFQELRMMISAGIDVLEKGEVVTERARRR